MISPDGILSFFSGLLCYVVLPILYYVFVHKPSSDPLRHFPGPVLNRLTCLPWIIHLWRGTQWSYAHQLHKKYGKYVRVAPNEVSFLDPAAWKDIYAQPRIVGSRASTFPELPKPNWFYRPNMSLKPNIISVDFETHAKIRKDLNRGFSNKNLRDQEDMITVYLEQLILQLLSYTLVHGKPGQTIDLNKWFGHCTTDIISDLALGESFGCLKEEKTSQEFSYFFERVIREDMILAGLRRIAPNFVTQIACKIFARDRINYLKLCKDTLKNQISNPSTERRNDLIQPLLNRPKCDIDSVAHTAALIIFAGEETTASTITAAVYFLARNPECMDKLVDQLRGGMFSGVHDITMDKVSSLSYLQACLNETMRIFPPISNGLPRITPPGHLTMIAGQAVPQHTNVSITPYALNHSPEYWFEPEKFIPERWLKTDPRFAYDTLHDGMKPFYLGPRDCIGQTLARIEMRLVLARFLYTFDVELDESCLNWHEGQRGWVTWARKPLFARLTVAKDADPRQATRSWARGRGEDARAFPRYSV